MPEWKGRKVHIKITNNDFEVVYHENVLLEADTITNLFEKFNPKEHCVSISPYMKGDDNEE